MLQKAVYKYSLKLLNKLISIMFMHISCTLYLIILVNDLLVGMFVQMKDFKVQVTHQKKKKVKSAFLIIKICTINHK